MEKIKQWALKWVKPMLHDQIEKLGDKLEPKLVDVIEGHKKKIEPEELAKRLVDKIQEELHRLLDRI